MERHSDMTQAVRPFTGWHMLALTVGAFSVIIGVNVFMAWQAIATFPGLEVKSSYATSQSFDATRAAQEALGWTVVPAYDHGASQLRIAFTGPDGQPVVLRDLDVLVGRPTETREDLHPTMSRDASGAYVSREALGPGKWMMQITAHAPDGTLYTGRSTFYVRN